MKCKWEVGAKRKCSPFLLNMKPAGFLVVRVPAFSSVSQSATSTRYRYFKVSAVLKAVRCIINFSLISTDFYIFVVRQQMLFAKTNVIHFRMAEPRFNNPYFWPPPPSMPGQVSPFVTCKYCDIFNCHLFPCVNVFSAIQHQSVSETNPSQFVLVD